MKGSLVAAALLALACASEPVRAPETASPKPRASAKNPASAQSSSAETDADYQAIVDFDLTRVAGIRGLAAQKPVKAEVIARGALLDRMKKDLLIDLKPEMVEGTNELIFSLGAVPADLDYLETVLKLLGSQLAGFYDPRVKEMVLLDDLGAEAQEVTLWHELVHALQDQHYDLGKLIKWEPDRGDSLSALQALAEGDATSAMFDVMLQPRGMTSLDMGDEMLKSMSLIEALPELAAVPAMLKRSVIAPYVDGVAFTHAVRRDGGWPAVDAAWRDPPKTTEQLLHPDKYRVREPAERVPPPTPFAGGPDRVIYHDVLGEQSLRIAFEEWVPPHVAAEAASGWAGDSVAVLATGERRAVAIRVRFDDEPHAVGAFEAFVRGALTEELETRDPGRPPVAVSRSEGKKAAQAGRVCRERARRGPFAVARVGRDLGVTLGPYQRRTGVATSDGDCATAARWAEAVAKAR